MTNRDSLWIVYCDEEGCSEYNVVIGGRTLAKLATKFQFDELVAAHVLAVDLGWEFVGPVLHAAATLPKARCQKCTHHRKVRDAGDRR